MRYSKAKIIFTTIASILCLFAIVFLIIVGINYSKNLTENGTDTSPKLVASVSNRKAEEAKKNKEEKSKEIKKTTKKEVKKTETTKKETKKEEVKEETDEVYEEQLEYTYDVSDEEYDPSINGIYRVQSLKVGDKEYSAKEIKELEESGTSMSLVINKYGIADVAVLDLKKMYEVTDEYFDDGIEQIHYSKNIGRIRIKIDDKEILFEKE